MGTVTAEKDRLRLTLLAVDSKEEDVHLREELEALLLVPMQRAAPYWFVVFWKDGQVEGLALDL